MQPPVPESKATPAKRFLQRWIVTVLGVLAAASTVSGIDYRTPLDLLLATLLLGTLNAFVRPVMLLLSLPFLLFTLGLFVFVINAALLYFVAFLLEGFMVRDFWAALRASVVISLVSLVTNLLLGNSSAKFNFRVQRGPRPPPANPADRRRVGRDRGGPPDGPGPVIDV